MRTKLKQITSVFLAVIMVFGIFAIVPFTASAATSGEFEYYNFADGTLEIADYYGTDNNVVIPDTINGYRVTYIGEHAFSDCSITSITIPDGVTTIGNYAFSGCRKLAQISIPDSVTDIGSDAFTDTAWLDNQSQGVVYAGKVAYSYKGQMPINTKIILKNGTVGIADKAFFYCENIISLKIPYSVKNIGSNVCIGCENLSEITFPDSLINIGGGSFHLTAWYNNQSDGIVYAGKVVHSFKGEMPKNANIVLADDTKGMADGTFYYCINLKSIALPNGITSISESAFSGCTNLSNVTIPNTVTTIKSAFIGCTSLLSVTIPKNVKNISDKAFGYYHNENWEWFKVKNFTIKGYKDTAAEKYAKQHGFRFIALEEKELSGDVNGDGKISIDDVTDIQKYIANMIDFTEEQVTLADVDKNGKVSIDDATLIQKHLAGLAVIE